MSSTLRKRKFALGRNARMLAAQCAERNREEKTTLPESLFHRALLQLVLAEKMETEDSFTKHRVGKVGVASSSFSDYLHGALAKLKLQPSVVSYFTWGPLGAL